MGRKLLSLTVAAFFLFNPLFTTKPLMAKPKTSAATNIPSVAGTIVETMNASGYTYMLVDSGDKKTWVAIPATTVEKGAKIKYYQGMVMENFTSKTLDRTFDAVVFSSGLAGKENETAPQPAAANANDSFSAAIKAEKSTSDVATTAPAMEKSGGSLGAIAPLEEISIAKAAAANGYTVAEIFAKAKELAGKKVQIHGKVVKFSPKIMGKNWIHLQDGTGDPMQNSHDLVVTSAEIVEVGSIVTLEGTLAAAKDFGAGYKYDALVEDAAVVK